jgi:hypothetical protein
MNYRPSPQHERIVGWLEALAILGGYSQATKLMPGLRPDVVRVGPHGTFVGDAKAHEHAGARGPVGRLFAYTEAVPDDRGLLIAVGTAVPADCLRWASTLEHLMPGRQARAFVVADALSVCWVLRPGSGGFVEDDDVDRLTGRAAEVGHPLAC